MRDRQREQERDRESERERASSAICNDASPFVLVSCVFIYFTVNTVSSS